MKISTAIVTLFSIVSLALSSSDYNHLAVSEDFTRVATIAKEHLLEHAKTYPTHLPLLAVKVTSVQCLDYDLEHPSIDVGKWENRSYRLRAEARFQRGDDDELGCAHATMGQEITIVLNKSKELVKCDIKDVSSAIGHRWLRYEHVEIDFSHQAELHVQKFLTEEKEKVSRASEPRIGVLFIGDHMFGNTEARVLLFDGDSESHYSTNNCVKYVDATLEK